MTDKDREDFIFSLGVLMLLTLVLLLSLNGCARTHAEIKQGNISAVVDNSIFAPINSDDGELTFSMDASTTGTLTVHISRVVKRDPMAFWRNLFSFAGGVATAKAGL